MKNVNLNTIFRLYDLRGKYPEQLNPTVAFGLGRAFRKVVNALKLPPRVAIAYDARPTSIALSEAFAKGFTATGGTVERWGLLPVPLFYFWCNEYHLAGTLSTASHMGEDYNGFKPVAPNGWISGKWLGLWKKFFATPSEPLKLSKIPRAPKVKPQLYTQYLQRLKTIAAPEKQWQILYDTGGGVMEEVIPFLSKVFPNIKVIRRLNDSKTLLEASRDKPHCLGISFDPDGDRISFAQEGTPFPNDYILALLIRYGPARQKVLAHRYVSRTVLDVAKEKKTKVYFFRTGHRFLKEALKRHKADFGIETSGHAAYRQIGTEAPLLTFLKILQVLEHTRKSLTSLIEELPRYHLIRKNLAITDADTFSKRVLRQFRSKTLKVVKFDGLNVELKDVWFNLRPSANDPVVRISVEGSNKDNVAQIVKELEHAAQ